MRNGTTGLPRVTGAFDRGVEHVEIHHEDAVVRVGRLPIGVFRRVRIAPLVVGRDGRDADELERLDALRLAVFEDLEVGRGEALDHLAVAARIGIDAHERGAGAEHGPLRLAAAAVLRLTGAGEHSHESTAEGESAAQGRQVPRVC